MASKVTPAYAKAVQKQRRIMATNMSFKCKMAAMGCADLTLSVKHW